MKEGFIPDKYRQFTSSTRERLAIADPVTRKANERLVAGTASEADRQTIIRGAYYAHWGLDMSTEEDRIPGYEREIDDIDYHKRYAVLYEGFIKRVFRLQAKINASETKQTVITTTDFDGNTVSRQVGQEFVDVLATMADRMRNTLYDGGYQSVINDIHTKLGINQSAENPNSYSMQVKGGDDTYGGQ